MTTAQGRPPAIDASRFPKKLWSDRHQPQGSHAHTPAISQFEHPPHTRKLSCRANKYTLHNHYVLEHIITRLLLDDHVWRCSRATLRYATPVHLFIDLSQSMLKSVAMMGCNPCVLVSATLACRHPCVPLNARLSLSGSGVLTSFDM